MAGRPVLRQRGQTSFPAASRAGVTWDLQNGQTTTNDQSEGGT